ncbi:FliH/SctL family protein [Limnohabitans sp. Jir61]|uniref:FliH/SctL family protein n=1 Tax=Limnohabitans sp. Jir61 TaxID=1826168 RepID=UPI0011B25BD8|nr:FliH/SctL family protein [Limnohabitans sp. Jir61]
MAHAELSETLVLSPITTDETTAELIVIHPDVFDVEDASQDVLISANSSIEGEVSEPVEAANPEVEETIEVVENLVPAIVGGIAPEEVEQREIEQFTKGLAQGKEEASVELAVAIEKAMAEGLEKGIQQGLEQGRAEGKEQGMSEGLELGLAQGVEQGKAQGIEEGRAQGDIEARDALTQEMSDQREVFENASKELLALIDDPKKFFEPLKRLALHIAEQVVIGELKTSSKAVERLVQRCLDELDHPVHGAVVLELNADDKARLQEHAGDFIKGMRLEAVPEMQPGSVRVFANDTVVEDLVEHRLDGLARALLVDVEAWREKSPLAKRILKIEEEEEDGDVHS